MQKIIRTEFPQATIVAVAHRLDTILDFDYVAVVHEGRVVEFGEVRVLKDDQDSKFAKLYNGDSVP